MTPVTPFDSIFNNIEDLINYRDMENFPYSHPQVISKAYNILNKIGNVLESIKSWTRLPLIQVTCIVFKTHF